MIKARDILIFFSIKYNGDWERIYDAISEKEPFNETDLREAISTVKSNCCTILDRDYPDIFTHSYHPPFVLYYYGDFSLIKNIDKNLAVVGSRHNSTYGEKMTKQLVSGICKEVNIVSGMAKGIDAIAHKTAIDSGGKTIAILGSGIDYPYPKINKDIYEEIKQNHLIISEYPNNTKPFPNSFPMRNRIIAGLSKSLLVTEAYDKSGTMITVSASLAMGKEVYCVPYQADAKSSCNRLIKEGAFMVETSEELHYLFFNK